MHLPMPEPAPVTSAVLPSSRITQLRLAVPQPIMRKHDIETVTDSMKLLHDFGTTP
jgi:hypothetical protein